MDTIVSILFAFFGIGLGVFMFFAPEDAISLQTRWKYDRADPSEKYIRLTRWEGLGLVVVCVVLLALLLFLPQ